MLALVSLTSGEFATLEFGDPVEPDLTTEAWLREVCADYGRRRPDLRESRRADICMVLNRLIENEPDDSAILVPLIRAAGVLGSTEVNRAVERHLRHADAQVKQAVIEALGRIGTWASADGIRPHLKSPDPALRRAAIVALGGVGRPQDISDIHSASAGRDDLEAPARESAARIRAVEKDDFEGYVDVLVKSKDCEDLFPLLVPFWRKLIPIVTDLSLPLTVRGNIVRLISHGCLRPAGPALLWVLVRGDDEPLDLRVEAAAGLGRCRLRQAVPLLVDLLQSNERRLVEAAVDSLGKLGMIEAIDPLLALWAKSDPQLRERIHVALSRLAAVEGHRLLAEILMPDEDAWQPTDAARPGDVLRFLDTESNTVIEGYERDLIRRQLDSSVPDARRDAALIAAFFGRLEDADMLTEFSRREPEDNVRFLMEAAAERLRRSAPVSSG